MLIFMCICIRQSPDEQINSKDAEKNYQRRIEKGFFRIGEEIPGALCGFSFGIHWAAI
jgi:hypothetical protein